MTAVTVQLPMASRHAKYQPSQNTSNPPNSGRYF